jgi:caspase 7
MNHTRRGIAVIFNHVNFSMPECPKRDGSDKDRDDLTELLVELDFEVLRYDDPPFRQVARALEQVSKMDHSDSDCLVIVVMSHGDNGKLYAKDREYSTAMLWKYFNAKSCPSLAGKPKLFFVQACRGTKVHPGHVLHYSSGVEEDGAAPNDGFYTIPVMADILVMYSTVEGFYSWRNPKEGGYFVQALVKLLRKYNRTKDLLTILTFVNREVAVNFVSESEDPHYDEQKQMCSIVSMLTRLVYFDKKCDT